MLGTIYTSAAYDIPTTTVLIQQQKIQKTFLFKHGQALEMLLLCIIQNVTRQKQLSFNTGLQEPDRNTFRRWSEQNVWVFVLSFNRINRCKSIYTQFTFHRSIYVVNEASNFMEIFFFVQLSRVMYMRYEVIVGFLCSLEWQ